MDTKLSALGGFPLASLGAPPPDPRYRLALRTRHGPPLPLANPGSATAGKHGYWNGLWGVYRVSGCSVHPESRKEMKLGNQVGPISGCKLCWGDWIACTG